MPPDRRRRISSLAWPCLGWLELPHLDPVAGVVRQFLLLSLWGGFIGPGLCCDGCPSRAGEE